MSQAHPNTPDTLDRPVPITHAQRHPELPPQPVPERMKRTISEAQKQSMAVGRAVAHEQRAKLHTRLLDFVKEQEEKLELIAEEEGVTVGHCRELLGTSLKKKRQVNLHNALISLKSAELNEAQGARISHTSEAKDVAAFTRKVSDESFNLYQHTGAISFGFVTRTNVDCTATPGWWATGNATDFVKEKLSVTMWDLMRALETWAVAAQSPLGGNLHNIADRKAECAAMILSNLRYITHSKDISMSYSHYVRRNIYSRLVSERAQASCFFGHVIAGSAGPLAGCEPSRLVNDIDSPPRASSLSAAISICGAVIPWSSKFQWLRLLTGASTNSSGAGIFSSAGLLQPYASRAAPVSSAHSRGHRRLSPTPNNFPPGSCIYPTQLLPLLTVVDFIADSSSAFLTTFLSVTAVLFVKQHFMGISGTTSSLVSSLISPRITPAIGT
ncbi:hypothetical protein C8J56DRAFT_1052839 [Mycena floridula]|nr:hypothetical protein C8J56DRAFT_1052839 [Mycena floridula]